MNQNSIKNFVKNQTFIISEIGVNHDGNFNKAKKLIKLSKDCGAHAVKFQVRDLDEIYNKKNKFKNNNSESGNQYIFNFLKKNHIEIKDYLELFKYSKKLGLLVGVTAWDKNSVNILNDKNIDFIKIGSPDFESQFLIEKCLQICKPIILSTGMSKVEDIKKISELLKNKDFALLHCCSSYPPKDEEISLKFLNSLKKISKIYGYSGHEVGFKPTLLSLYFGSRIIERHITISNDDDGPDHSSSLNPIDFKKMCLQIKLADTYLKKKRSLNEFIQEFNLFSAKISIGKNSKFISQNTKFNKITLGKSIIYNKNFKKGSILKKKMLDEKSPGYGYTSINYKSFIGKKLIKDVKKGDYLFDNHFKLKQIKYNKIPMKWGLVGRLGDFENFIKEKPKLIEIHLTWRELLNPKNIVKKKYYDQELVVHAPEYFNDKLIDFTIKDSKILDLSFEMMQRTIDLTKKISNNFVKTNNKTKIVLHPGGHSFHKNEIINKNDKYKNLLNNLKNFKEDNYEIVLENIPPFPWYYGGRYFQNIFSNHKEIRDFCISSNKRICFDTSHAQLYCNANHISMREYAKSIKDHTCYLHISDAIGTDGEGAQIGEGNVDFEFLLSLFKSKNLGFIPEIWQGHLNEGEGFKMALKNINLILKKISNKKCGHQ